MRYRMTNTRAEWLPMDLPIVPGAGDCGLPVLRANAAAWAVYAALERDWARLGFDRWRLHRTLETLHHRAAFTARNNPFVALGC